MHHLTHNQVWQCMAYQEAMTRVVTNCWPMAGSCIAPVLGTRRTLALARPSPGRRTGAPFPTGATVECFKQIAQWLDPCKACVVAQTGERVKLLINRQPWQWHCYTGG